MQFTLKDLAYLAKVYEATKTDTPPIIPVICPECDETVETDDTEHITLNTRIPGYWAQNGGWGEIDPYGMNSDSRPMVLIGCEGYHTIGYLFE